MLYLGGFLCAFAPLREILSSYHKLKLTHYLKYFILLSSGGCARNVLQFNWFAGEGETVIKRLALLRKVLLLRTKELN